jgi:Fe-S-cluster containining protein
MITRLMTTEGERVYDGEIGRFVEASLIPCHRCGVCCERWQPLVSAAEVARLAGYLGITPERFQSEYTTSYPFDDETHLLQRSGRGCIFLRYDEDGRSACTVHPARPDACRDWTASLERRECRDGLARFGAANDLVPLVEVYPLAEERTTFTRVVRGGCDGER